MQKINVVKKIVALSLMVLVGTGAIVSAQAPGEAPTDMTFEDWRRAQRQLNGQPEEVRDEQQRLDELTALAYGAHQWRRESEGQQPWVSPDEVRQMMQDDETGDLIERAEALNRTFTHLRQLVEQQQVHQVHIDGLVDNIEVANDGIDGLRRQQDDLVEWAEEQVRIAEESGDNERIQQARTVAAMIYGQQVHIDNIIANIERTNEFVEEGNEQLEAARRYQQSRCQLL